MNDRLLCADCSSQPCMCPEFECYFCKGTGEVTELDQVGACGACNGTGWIKCTRGGVDCPFEHCYCEAAWERQQEDRMSEPPITLREQHMLAYEQKRKLR